MAHRLRDLWWEVRSFLGGLAGKLGRWLDPLAGSDEVRYKSSKEIALDNAAESLGADVGGYYPEDWEISEDLGVTEIDDLTADVRARGDAAREEMLVYIDRIWNRRERRRRVRRIRIAVLTTPLMFLLLALVFGSAFLAGEESPRRGAAASRPWLAQLARLPLYGPNSQHAIAHQPAPVAHNMSFRVPRASAKTVDSARAYVSQGGMLCLGIDELVRGVVRRSAGGGCLASGKLRRTLDAECATFLSAGGSGAHVSIAGFAHRDVSDVVGVPQQGRGPLRIRLSRTWVPRAPGIRLGGIEPLRVFMVSAPFVHDRVSASGSDGTSNLNPYAYKLATRLGDGRLTFMRGFYPHETAKGPGCA